MHLTTKLCGAIISSFALYSCGVSDYINSKKIANAPSFVSPVKTSECEFNERRIQRVSNYLNKIRSSKRLCGSENYPAVPAINWNHNLYIAAKSHSDDMAENNFFNHKNSRGLSPSDRVTNADYDWRSVAENIAGGENTPEQTFEQWLASPGHCHNLMSSSHTEFALACTRNNISDYRIYWTLVLASPDPSQ